MMFQSTRESQWGSEACGCMLMVLSVFYGVYAVVICSFVAVMLFCSIIATVSALFILDHEMMWVLLALDISEQIILRQLNFYEWLGTLSSSSLPFGQSQLVMHSTLDKINDGASPKPDTITLLNAIPIPVVIAVCLFVRAYILFSPVSAALQDTYFYYWYVILFKVIVANMVNYMTILIQLLAGLCCAIISFNGGNTASSCYILLLCLVGPPFSILAMYISYLEIFKFDWKHLINQYLVSKSDDLQEGVSNPTDGSSSIYYFTLCLVIIYAVLLFSNVRTVANKLMKKKEQVKQVGIVHTTPYYQAIPLNLSSV